MANWSEIINMLKSKSIPFASTGKRNKLHVAKKDITPELQSDLESRGIRMANIYNDKMVQRPAYIQQDIDAVQLTPADKTVMQPRGIHDFESAAYKKRQLEPDSVALAMPRAIAEAQARHGITTYKRKPTDAELYELEGDIQGGGAGVANQALVSKFMSDSDYQQEALDRIYHTLKASGANKDAEALIRNVKARYGIDYKPSSVSPLEFGKHAEITNVTAGYVPKEHGLPGDIYNEHTNPTWYKIDFVDPTGKPSTIVHPYPRLSRYVHPATKEEYTHNALADISARKIAELPMPYRQYIELTDPTEIAKHMWYPMQGNYSHPLGFISEDGRYFVNNNNALPLNFRHYVAGEGPYKLK